jgi:hypothetical protein
VARNAVAPLGAAPPFAAVIFDLGSGMGESAVEPWLVPGTVDLVRRLHAGRVLVGLVAGDTDLGAVPGLNDIRDLLDVMVTSTPAVGEGVNGDTDEGGARAGLTEAARRLGVPPSRTAVVTVGGAGVRAARGGGFGLVAAIDGSGERVALEAAGADLVLADVALVDLGVLRTDPWVLAYEGFDPAHEGHREALTALGNGYVGVRGAAPEHTADGVHYPGTYLAGVYNRLTSTVQGREVEDEHLVNAPNWLLLDLRVDDGGWWSAGGLVAHRERRELDLRRGLLTRHVQLTDQAGR